MDDRETGLNPQRIAEAAAVYRTSDALTMPPVEVHPSAEQRVKLPQVQAILPSLFETLNRAAAVYGIPVSHYRLRVRWDPSEGYQELVVEPWVLASAEEAEGDWDTFDEILQDWLDTLPDSLHQYAVDFISVGVRWDGDGFPF